MLGYTTKAILGLIATLTLAIFVFALAASITSGFAGFYGGLPFWIIVIFVVGLASFDYLEECIEIGDGLQFLFKIGGVLFAGGALTYGAWGTSTLFTGKGELLVRSRVYGNYTVEAAWFETFWQIACVVLGLLTVLIAYRMLRNRSKAQG